MWREDVYRYKYVPIPQQDDPVARVIISISKALKRENCDFANVSIKVWGTTSAPPIWPPQACPPGHSVKFYTFTQEAQEFPLTVPITIVPAFGPLSPDTLYVYLGNSKVWTPLKEWLPTIPDLNPICARTPPEMTRIWRTRNGRTFCLMDLPSELRAIIFEYTLGPEIYPLSKVPVRLQERSANAQRRGDLPGFRLLE